MNIGDSIDSAVGAIGNFIDPAVCAAVITGILTALIFLRKSSHTYVTGERSLWRKEMKSSIVALSAEWHRNPNSQAVQQALESIKCNLNPYGKLDNLSEAQSEKLVLGDPVVELYLRDAHIWQAIKAFNDERSEVSLDNLVYYLALLLKYDWERSKAEVKVNIFYFVAFASAILGCYSLAQTIKTFDLITILLVSFLYLMGTLGLSLLLFVFQHRFSAKELKMGLFLFALDAVALVALAYRFADSHYSLSYMCAMFTFCASVVGCFRGAYGIAKQYANNVNKYRVQTRKAIQSSDVAKTNSQKEEKSAALGVTESHPHSHKRNQP